MRLALALFALAATAVLLRKRRPVTAPQCDDSDIVGMPTTWERDLLVALGLDEEHYRVVWDMSPTLKYGRLN